METEITFTDGPIVPTPQTHALRETGAVVEFHGVVRATAQAAIGIAAVTATGLARNAVISSSAAGHQPRHERASSSTIQRAHAYTAQVVKKTIAVSGMKVWL